MRTTITAIELFGAIEIFSDPWKYISLPLRLVDEDVHFRAGARRGIEQAERGELVDHNEVKARIERLLQP